MRNRLWTISGLVLALVTAGVQAQPMPRGRSGGRFSTARPDDERSPSMSRVAPSPRATGRSDPRRTTPVKRAPVAPVKRAPVAPVKRAPVVPVKRAPVVPVKRAPVVKHPPAAAPRAGLRPGVGYVPSGTRQADRGKLKDFVPPPGSHSRTVARPPSPATYRPPAPRTRTPAPVVATHRPPVVTTRRPPVVTTHRPPVVTTYRPPVVTTRRPPVVTTHRPPVVTPRRRPSIYQPPVTVARTPAVYRPTWGRQTPFTTTWYQTRVAHVPTRRSRYYYPWQYNRPGHGASHWWARATLATLANWMRHRWDRPVYYVYGLDGNVYYQGTTVYVDGVRHSTADDYYRQARAIALAVPNLDDAAAARLEWYPLGVFAITRQGVSATQSYVQLAVTREGQIGGTYFNQATGTSRPIEGSVDQASQRAAWTFADGRNTDFVVETSFHNLTQDQVPVLVHFGPERAQEGLLVRVEAPT